MPPAVSTVVSLRVRRLRAMYENGIVIAASADRAQTVDDADAGGVPGRQRSGGDADENRRADLHRDRLLAHEEDREQRAHRVGKRVGDGKCEGDPGEAADE